MFFKNLLRIGRIEIVYSLLCWKGPHLLELLPLLHIYNFEETNKF